MKDILDYKSIITCTKCRGNEGYAEEMLPILAFGNSKAPFLLLSLNPSFNEYKQTPPPLSSLPKNISREEMSDITIKQTLMEQQTYFNRDYYKTWFDEAEGFLKRIVSKKYGKLSFGIENLKSNVTNIDICKCATIPIWGQLEKESRKKYLSNCIPFFIEQIFDESVKGIIANGTGIYEELKKILKCNREFLQIKIKLKTVLIPINNSNNSRIKTCKVYLGIIERIDGRKIFIFGTSQRISSDHYGNFRDEQDRSRVAMCIQEFINKVAI